ncbi:inner membrane complex suture component, putative (ISC1) [Plasmodium ovale wallikeri]|uniref:Inner membrane complex suture component, putative (ISC1) n=1 Tax=Plasmodium ovale wallikeri TaxID=864142 RepID=A0A1A8Z994_PLAOA|nr:inner membrane complex suture component, putative (ISC1) [Plasmodium ovale wallikeri]
MNKYSTSKSILSGKEISKKLSKDTNVTERSIYNKPEKVNTLTNSPKNEISYNINYSTSGGVLAPESVGANVENIANSKSYDSVYFNHIWQNKHFYPHNNYMHNEVHKEMDGGVRSDNRYYPEILDGKLSNTNGVTGKGDAYNFYNGNPWNAHYPSNLENYDYLEMDNFSNHFPSVNCLPYGDYSGNNKQLYSAENALSPLYSRYPNVERTERRIPPMKPYHSGCYSKRYPSFCGRTSHFPFDNNECNSVCSPSYESYENEYPYMGSYNFGNMPAQIYYLSRGKDEDSFVKKGMNCALNGCNLNMNKSHIPKYEYIVQGPQWSNTITNRNNNKFDVFKKITLTVGTYLDDAVNTMIDMLESSYKSLTKRNSTNLYDLYPFYNPDPYYSRKERPTLKTGNNLLDKINSALDGSTLEKHKNLPRNFGRIAIPKTERTGSKVVDGINNMLDSLLDEPLSYRKYDYFSDKHKNVNSIKQ